MSATSIRIFHSDRTHATATAEWIRTVVGWDGPIALTETKPGELATTWANTIGLDGEVAS